ncbi:hypothetical protein OUY22_15175 [Nonomuraea sp. MCN248]|uniref:Uncharacterized protein n=1 Tax=Nonomuraea corallina TaxID=2989783 RepID=A0ABT4SC93_9ACTN|nr:hypothetical protein [Nonomuraea corallina]MDA0634765.1 hypothetical protein [Nonomuraea corallina]
MTDGSLSRWPLTVLAVYLLLALQLLWGVIATILGVVLAVAALSLASWGALLLSATHTGLTGWILARFPRRERRLRWGTAALQAAWVAVSLVYVGIGPGFGARSLLTPSLIIPSLVIALLLTPAAARWFDR